MSDRTIKPWRRAMAALFAFCVPAVMVYFDVWAGAMPPTFAGFVVFLYLGTSVVATAGLVVCAIAGEVP